MYNLIIFLYISLNQNFHATGFPLHQIKLIKCEPNLTILLFFIKLRDDSQPREHVF